jgi:transposase
VAGAALAHRINVTLVQKWRRQARGGGVQRVDAIFVPVAVVSVTAPTSAGTPALIQIEVRRGAVSARIQWPVSAAADCAAWMREWLG